MIHSDLDSERPFYPWVVGPLPFSCKKLKDDSNLKEKLLDSYSQGQI